MTQILTINPLQVLFDERSRPQFMLGDRHVMVKDIGESGQSSSSSKVDNARPDKAGTLGGQMESLAAWDQYLDWFKIPAGSPSTSTSQSPFSPSATAGPSVPQLDSALPDLGADQWLNWFDQQSRQIDTPSTISTPHSSSVPLGNPEDQWQIVLDRKADSSFFYCVKSTRIFCRPTCPSRRPVRENVEFVPTPEEATERGYRACRRCRPTEVLSASEDRQAEMVLQAQGLLRTWKERGKEKPPTLQELAEETGMSKFYLLRTFKRIVGKTPEAYAKSL